VTTHGLPPAVRVASALIYVLVLVVGVALGIRVIVGSYSPVPAGDLWSQFPFIERGVRGDIGLSELWAQHNEHRVALARLQFVVDYRFFEGTNVFLFSSIATSCLVLGGTFAAAVWFETRDWLLALGVLAVAGATALPLAGSENLLGAFQVSFVQGFLFSTVAILGVVRAARSIVASRQAMWTGVTAIAAAASTYSLANGLLAWVIVVVVAIVLGLPRRNTAALAIAGVVTIATYFWHFDSVSERNLSDPLGLAHYVLLFLGSAPTPTSGTAAIAGAVGLILAIVLCRLAWLGRAGRSTLVPFGAAVSAFIVLSAVLAATNRLDLGVAQALGSRYSIASYTFWLGIFVGFLPAVGARLDSRSWAPPAYVATVALVALALAYGALPSRADQRSLVVGREATVVAHRVGVEDATESVRDVQFVWTPVTNALRWLERERLGPWRPGGMVDGMRVTGPANTTGRACLGELNAAEPVGGGSRLGGWIAPPNGEATSRNLVVLDAGGRRAGLGIVGFERPGLEQPGVDAEWRGFVAYVRGAPSEPLDVVLLANDGSTAVCRLPAEGETAR
jgi:hypothetical protein